MIEVSGIRIPLDEAYRAESGAEGDTGVSADVRIGAPSEERLADSAAIRRRVASACGIGADEIRSLHLAKLSVDARKKSDVHFMASFVLEADAACEARALSGAAKPPVSIKRHEAYDGPRIPHTSEAACAHAEGDGRIVVVGSGPAGLFAAWYLAKAGLKPYLIERGGCVEDRLAAVDAFTSGGALDPDCNIQFGEGGAGTFSDGKLTTNTKNPRCRDVLRIFVDAGAPREILWRAKPHIGTDMLIDVVRTMREDIERMGGSVFFDTRMEGIECVRDAEGVQRIAAVRVRDLAAHTVRDIPCADIIVATGHSARDTFSMLHASGARMEAKPFSVGVRIEHLQAAVDRAQYGGAAGHPALHAADYKLSVHLPGGRGVYTFCMCPGGEVVCAASEEGGVVVNGMSRFARDGVNANAAVLVGVDPDDYGANADNPLAGVDFQRSIEHAAFEAAVKAGGAPYAAPAQRVGDFLGVDALKPASSSLARRKRPESSSAGVEPTYARGVAWCDLDGILPAFVTDALREALPLLDRRLHGFADPDAIMTGVETRSSSPVRILRGDDFQSNIAGLYPCGEGAGYAGGIMSAAVDGLRVAEQVAASRA